MDKTLKKITNEYIEKVDEVSKIILNGLDLQSKEDFMFHHRILRPYGEFEFNGVNKYCFHGIGCRFENAQIKIDWDFGYKSNSWCGLNPFLLAEYIKEYYEEMKNFHDGGKIQQEFDKATAHGEMIKRRELYYFSFRGQKN